MLPSPHSSVPQPTKYRTVEASEEGLPAVAKDWPVKFLYAHSPQGWTYDDGTMGREPSFLPIVSELKCIAGAGWMPDLKAGQPFDERAIATARAKFESKGKGGGRVFLWGDPALGPYAEYMDVYPVQGGGKYYVPWCMKPVRGVGGNLTWESDREEFRKFQEYLRERVLYPMTVEVYRALLDNEERTLERLQGSTAPNAEARAKEQAARMGRMAQAWVVYCKAVDDANQKARATQPAGAAPKPRKGGSAD